MSSIHIDDEHRRRLLWTRHQLGHSGRSDRTVADVASALALLHSTDPVTPYLSIQARSHEPDTAVDVALYDERTLLRHTSIRRTVFTMPLDVVPLAHGAFNLALVERLRTNLLRWIEASADVSGDAADFLDRAEAAVIDRLGDRGPATGGQLSDELADLRVTIDPVPGASYSTPIRITSKLLEIAAAEGRIARGRPTGRDYTSGAWTWAVVDDWLGPEGLRVIDQDVALAGLVDRYLRVFGPATLTDLTWWTGLGKRRLRGALGELEAVEVSLDAATEPGYVAADDDLDAADFDERVALLPGLDSTTMGWKQRSWYVDDRPAAELFDKNGNAGPTVWCRGRVVGAWTQRRDGVVHTDVGADDVGADELAAEVERLRQWLGDVRVNWRYPTPATKRLAAG